MKIILLKDIPNVGHKYKVLNVASGYARNFLIPKGIAQLATPAEEKHILKLRIEQEKEIIEQEKKANKVLSIIGGKTITIKKTANEKGNLFAQINPDDLIAPIKEQLKISILPSSISFDKPVKELGKHTAIVLGPNKKTVELTVFVEMEDEKNKKD